MTEGQVEPEWLEALRRNSGLALDAEGRWRYAAGFVENERVSEMFHQGVAVRPDGEVTLTVGKMWAYVKCEGPAFFVRAVKKAGADGDAAGPLGAQYPQHPQHAVDPQHPQHPQQRVVELAGGREIALAGATFGWGPDERLYVWLQGVDGPALLLRTPHQGLLAGLEEKTGGGLRLIAAGESFDVVRIPERPGPAAPRPGSSRPGV
jgi:hypothetical protein